MKRKIISLLLAITLTASFIGCGKEEVQDSSSNMAEENKESVNENEVRDSIDVNE